MISSYTLCLVDLCPQEATSVGTRTQNVAGHLLTQRPLAHFLGPLRSSGITFRWLTMMPFFQAHLSYKTLLLTQPSSANELKEGE